MYKQKYQKNMSDDIAAHIPNDTGKLLAGLAAPRHMYIAQSLHAALQDNGAKDPGAIADLIGNATNEDFKKINAFYQQIFNKSPLDDIREDTEPSFKKALQNLLGIKRVEQQPFDVKGTRIAESTEKFHKEIQNPTEEGYFVHFFTESPFAHIRNVDKAYHQKYRQGIVTAAAKVLSGELLALATAITVIKSEYWANRFHDALKPGSINNEVLKRAFILTNDGNDLATVNSVYKRTFEGVPSLATDAVYFAAKDYQRIFER
eukprot:Phypoly_transcript_05040.p1 GENE.Phypoly_transcript_05040~~Phypoly_transcript_05040.p1  ORF type:complete len:261 (+),score=46.71 Phypoly_transcript_05040:438-1220(+)